MNLLGLIWSTISTAFWILTYDWTGCSSSFLIFFLEPVASFSISSSCYFAAFLIDLTDSLVVDFITLEKIDEFVLALPDRHAENIDPI